MKEHEYGMRGGRLSTPRWADDTIGKVQMAGLGHGKDPSIRDGLWCRAHSPTTILRYMRQQSRPFAGRLPTPPGEWLRFHRRLLYGVRGATLNLSFFACTLGTPCSVTVACTRNRETWEGRWPMATWQRWEDGANMDCPDHVDHRSNCAKEDPRGGPKDQRGHTPRNKNRQALCMYLIKAPPSYFPPKILVILLSFFFVSGPLTSVAASCRPSAA